MNDKVLFVAILGLAITGVSFAIADPFDLPLVYAEVIYENEQHWDNTYDTETNVGVVDLYLPRIKVDDTWKDYFLDIQPDKVIYRTESRGGFIYDIPSCSYSIYDSGYNGQVIIPSMSAIAIEKINDEWQHMAVNEESCNVEVIEDYDNYKIEIISIKENANEKFETDLVLSTAGIKETWKVTSNTQNPLGITQTAHTESEIIIGDEIISIADYNGQSFDRQFLEDNQARIFGLAQKVGYNFQDAFDSLTAVNISQDGELYKVNLDYSDGNFIGYLQIDPTSTVSGSMQGMRGFSGTGSSCQSFYGPISYQDGLYMPPSTQNYYCQYIKAQTTFPNIGLNQVTSATHTMNYGSAGYTSSASCRVALQGGTSYSSAWSAASGAGGTLLRTLNCGNVSTGSSTGSVVSGAYNTLSSYMNGGSTHMVVYGFTATSRGSNANGGYPTSSSLSITYNLINPPDDPTNLTITQDTAGELDLSWSQTGTVTGFKIERSLDNSSWTTLTSNTGTTTTTYTDTGLNPNTLYYYRVFAYDSTYSIYSDNSVSNSQTTWDYPEQVTGLSATDGDPISLSWTAPASDDTITGYKLYRDTNYIKTVTGTSTTDAPPNYGQTYSYTVSAVSGVGEGSQSTSASATYGSPPNPPTGVSTSINSPNSNPFDITVSWSAPANVGSGTLSGFEIYRDASLVTTVGLVTSYTDTVSGIGTYTYTVRAVSNHGTSTDSNSSQISTPIEPDAPSLSLAINNPDPNPFDVTVSFTEGTSNGGSSVTGYNLYSSPDNTTYTSIVNATSSPYTTTVSNSGTWYFKAESINNVGTSALSSAYSIATPTVPDAPSLTLAINNPDPNPLDITVSFTEGVSNGGSSVTGYNLYSSPDDVTYTLEASAVTTSQTITVSISGTWYFKAESINNVGTSALSTAYNIITPTVPDAPTGLVVTTLSDTQLQLDYVAPVFDGGSALQGYIIEVENPPNTWTQVASTPNTTFTYTGTISTEYNFRVSAYNNVGSSNPSSNASGWTLASAPTNLVASTVSGDTINLTFDTPAHTVTDYKVYKETPIGNGFTLDQTVAYATACTSSCSIDVSGDSGLIYNTYIVAVNLGGDSTASNEANAWTLSDPPSNIVLTSNPNTATQVTIDWDAPTPDAVTGYLIERNDGNGWVVVNANTQSQATIIVDTGLQLSTTYEYRIATINLGGTGSYSTTSSITTYSPPDPPIGISFDLQKVPVGSNDDLRIKLTLDMTGVNLYSGTVQGYKIERNVDNAGWTVLTANTGTTGLSATDTGLSRSSVYQYRVSTITQIATGSPSNAFQAEFLDGEIVWQLIPVEGNTIRGEISFDETNGLPNGYAQSLLIVQHDNSNQAITTAVQTVNYVNSTLPQGLELDGLTTLPDFYVYDIGGYNYTAYVTTTQDGMTHIFESGILFASPTNAFGGQIFADEYRDQTSYTNSTLSVRAQPADFDYVVRYQHQNPNIEPQFFAFNGIEANNTSTAPVLPNSDYYVSVFVNPTEFDYNIVDPTTGEAEIECNENSPKTCPAWTSIRTPNGEVTYHLNESYGAIENIPSGIESDYTLRSFKSPDSPVQLGLEPMGDLFGMPMVFIFIIALGAVFTGRSAQMGVVFIVATIGLMVYMGYLSFDFGTNGLSEAITWGLIVVAMILGVLVGKRWS